MLDCLSKPKVEEKKVGKTIVENSLQLHGNSGGEFHV